MRFAVSAAAVLALLAAAPVDAAPSRAAIEKIVKAEMAEMVDGINAHDVQRATAFDADDILTMESGRPPSVGAKADRDGLGMAMKYVPSWRLRRIEESVDVPASGDLAIYRSTYWQDSDSDNGTHMTQKVNFIAEFRPAKNGKWLVKWSVVCNQEKPHAK